MVTIKHIVMPSIATAFVIGVIFGGFKTVSAQLAAPNTNSQEQSNQQQNSSQTNQGEESSDEASSDQKEKNDKKEENNDVYSYVAQPGDSYTLMARKAVQTYGINNKVDLSKAQIIFTETNITQEAGSPRLIIGQKVEIKKDSVKNWVEQAKKLSLEKQNSWAAYAEGVNFNTNSVGQAS